MQFKQYPSYKNSGVEWLGDVPEHWGMNRLGVHFRNRKEKVSDKDFKPLSVTKHGIVPQLEHAAKSDNGDNRKLVRKGDYVINSRSDRKGSSGLADLDGSVSLINIVLTPFKTIHPKFSHYLLRSYLFQEEFYKYGHGIVADLWTTNYEDMRNIHLALPSVSEQTQISNFLEQETTRIDNLIAKQEKLIELLEEQRKSIISHAVTKGLNPDAPMKDSGVEWLGDVPEHWNISKLRYYLDGIKDGTHGTHVSTTEGQLLLSGKNIKNGKLVITDNERKISLEDHQKITANGFPKKGDLLINVVGTIGQSCIYELDTPISFQRSVCFLRANNKLKPNFLQRILESNLSQNQLKILTNKSTIGGVYMGDLVELIIPVVPIKEQNKITDYLDREIQEIVNCIDKQKLLIEKLIEYRTSIISHAVTGKIDVREFDA